MMPPYSGCICQSFREAHCLRDAMFSCRSLSTFWRDRLHPTSGQCIPPKRRQRSTRLQFQEDCICVTATRTSKLAKITFGRNYTVTEIVLRNSDGVIFESDCNKIERWNYTTFRCTAALEIIQFYCNWKRRLIEAHLKILRVRTATGKYTDALPVD
jgi:hypothetical protein